MRIVRDFNTDALFNDPDNLPEYLRGQVELLADLFGYGDESDMDGVRERILRDLRPAEHANPVIRQSLEAIWAVLPEDPNRALGVFDLLADIDRANSNAR